MRLLRIQEVISVTGLSRMTIYRFEKEGTFPKRRRLGKNSVAWLDEDISDWVAGRPSVVQPSDCAASRIQAAHRRSPVTPALRNGHERRSDTQP